MVKFMGHLLCHKVGRKEIDVFMKRRRYIRERVFIRGRTRSFANTNCHSFQERIKWNE